MKGQFPAVFNLSALNGQNGFKIDGENNQDYSGISVSSAGDINGDGHNDLLIGAYGYPGGSSKGRSYVVFGGLGVGNGGVLSLSSLNGANGFKLDGENNGDISGNSVSMVGDINSDGHDDLLIGAYGYPGGSNKGRSYVVFGGTGIGSSGILSLSGLNGTNGFKLDGENNNDYSGRAVSAAGDINGDGRSDLIVGAYLYTGGSSQGRSYVVFGGAGIGSSGTLNLSDLNGTNGFKLDGDNGDQSGYSVSTAGDINSDGWADLIIGAQGYPANNFKGCSYVLFGGPEVGGSGIIALSNLNGTNGFKIYGENNGDYSYHVRQGGDINNDGHTDIIIGAHGYPRANWKGRSYVVFGRKGIGGNGILNLSSLNGTNGFKLNGENNNDYSGWSISAAGDINGDKQDDLIIGAYGYPEGSSKGRSYVVFGGLGVGNGGVLNLSSLNGANGFKLDGENNGDQSGFFISAVGDINSDGCIDLIIAANTYGSGQWGRSYAVFGDLSPQLLKNQLTIHSGEAITFTSQHLNATDNSPPSQLNFTVTNVTHGYFAWVNNSSHAITEFSQSSVWSLQIEFVHDGSSFPPSYSIQVVNPGIALSPPSQNATITFYRKPLLSANQLLINQGQSGVVITSSFLGVIDDYLPDQVNFTITNLQHGQFKVLPFNNSVTQFSEQQLLSGDVFFTQDGTSSAPSFQVVVSDPYFTLPPVPIAVTFYAQPTLICNPLVIHQGESITMTPTLLQVMDDYPSNQVKFTVSNVQNGKFTLLPSNISIAQFNKQQLLAGEIQFTQDGLAAVPNYQLAVYDPYFTLPPTSPASITFYPRPTFIANQLIVSRNAVTLITAAELSVNDSYPDSQITLKTESVHGQFELISAGNQSITEFTQQQVKTGQIQFHHLDSIGGPTDNVPSYNVTVTDPYFTVGPVAGNVNYQFIPFPPQVINPISPQFFDIDGPIKFIVPTIPPNNTFVDPNEYPLALSATLANGSKLPYPYLGFDSATSTLFGSISWVSDWNISLNATNTAGLSAQTFMDLRVINPNLLSSASCTLPGLSHYSSTDVVCTAIHNAIIAIPSTFGGLALALLGLFLRQRDVKKTWNESRYAIHNYLRRELNLEIGRATNEARYISGIYKLLGAILGIEEQKEEKGNRRDSHYELQIGEQVTQMSAEHQIRYGQAIVSAIRDHILFPKLCCDEREAQERKGVKLKMPIYRYFNGSIPNPLSCFTTYEFRPDVLGAAFEGIVETAKSSLSGDLGLQLPLSSPKISRGRGSSGLFQDSSEAPGQIQMELTHIRPSTSFSAEGT